MRAFERMLAKFVGASTARLEQSSEEDTIFAVRLGLHLLLTFCFLAGTAYYALTVAIPPAVDSWGSPAALVIALIMALLILFIDIYIIHASWYDQGRTELDSIRPDRRFRRKDGTLLRRFGFRIGISIFVSVTLASFIDLRIFENEVNSILDANFEKANRPIKDRIRANIDKEIAARSESVNQASNSLTSIQEQMKNLQKGNERFLNLDAQIDRIGKRIEVIDGQISSRRKEMVEYQLEIECEIAGRICTNQITGRITTGKRGCGEGTQCHATKAMLDRISTQIDVLTEDQNTLRIQFDQLTIQRTQAEARAPNADAALRALENSDKFQRGEVVRLTKERDKLIESIEVETEARFKHDGSAIARSEGLLARFLAFEQFLQTNPSALIPFFVITIVTILLEMSAVISKMWFSPKNVYAIKTAAEYDEAVRAALYATNPSLDFETKWAEAEARVAKLQAEFDALKKGYYR